MEATDDDQQRVFQLLTQDLAATTGSGHEAIVQRHATYCREYVHEADAYMQKVVDDVQQQLHDEFIDTTWPRCPRHHRHPLWYREGSWWCEHDNIAIAPLGALRGT
jgi:hypothetical protein